MSCASGLRKLPQNLAGTTERQWQNAMGRGPNSISAMAHGNRLLQWQTGTYIRQHIAVLFGPDHRFIKVSHRYQC